MLSDCRCCYYLKAHTQELASFMIFKPCLMTYKNLKMPRKVFTLIVFNLFLIILGAFAIKYILSCSPKVALKNIYKHFITAGSAIFTIIIQTTWICIFLYQ